MARDVLTVASYPMRLVDDDEVPACGGQIRRSGDVVALDSLVAPSPSCIEGLDGVQRDDHSVHAKPEVVLPAACHGSYLRRSKSHELLTESSLELTLPLAHESLWGEDQDSACLA